MIKSFLFTVQIILVSTAVPLKDRSNKKDTATFSYIGSYTEQETKARLFDLNDYFASVNPATWSNALADCRRVFGRSANLVTIETVGEWQFLKEYLLDYAGTRYWTSGMYDPMSNVWRWTANNQPIPVFGPWERGYPTNPRSILRVLISYINQYDAFWLTEVNTRMERFICEVPNEMVPNVPTTSDPFDAIEKDCDHNHEEVPGDQPDYECNCKPITGQKRAMVDINSE